MMDTKKNLKPREDLKSSFTLKNLRFKPQKYKEYLQLKRIIN